MHVAHSKVDANTSGVHTQGSLRRLGQSSVGLYQIHWPGFPLINNWATEAFVEGLATVQKAGLAKVRLLICLLCMSHMHCVRGAKCDKHGWLVQQLISCEKRAHVRGEHVQHLSCCLCTRARTQKNMVA